MRGRLPLGDVARTVHTNEEKRHAWCTLALQRGKPVAYGLEAHTKALRELVDVVMQLLRRLQERRIRQHQRARKIVGQPDARQPARGVVGPWRRIQQAIHHRRHLQHRQLRGQLE
ncbi:hypothetical protein SDC9_104616 [bioreactor metagenome]|uniref:Uncharacterized protein n=1 Tax=bioreactor metagenome TaxID=1076179 RepID=A0A645B3R4_9ZZZZ